MDPTSRSILLGGRTWRCAVDPPIEQRDTPVAGADELAATFATGRQSGLLPDTGAKLVELCVRARQAYPMLVDRGFDRDLVVAIAARAPTELTSLDAYLDRCRPADLALALAAGRGVPAAIQELERAYRTTIDSTCRRFASPTHTPEDLKQILRAKLFVADAPDKLPKIADYAGQGFLENWLRVTAVRIFLDLARRKDRNRESHATDEAVLALPQPGDLALDIITAEYREAVTAAMHEAAKRLPAGDRHLLRQHFVAGLSIDQLGAVLGIHRATAARRISRAREQLVAETRDVLARTLALAPDELDNVLGLVMSRLDVSISKLLATEPGR